LFCHFVTTSPDPSNCLVLFLGPSLGGQAGGGQKKVVGKAVITKEGITSIAIRQSPSFAPFVGVWLPKRRYQTLNRLWIFHFRNSLRSSFSAFLLFLFVRGEAPPNRVVFGLSKKKTNRNKQINFAKKDNRPQFCFSLSRTTPMNRLRAGGKKR